MGICGLSEEENKAIEVIKKRTERLMEELKIEKEDFIDEPKIAYLMQEIEANKRLLNLIQKQDTEINKLNNVIDRMAEDMAGTNKAINEEYAVDELYLDKNKIKEYFMKERRGEYE